MIDLAKISEAVKSMPAFGFFARGQTFAPALDPNRCQQGNTTGSPLARLIAMLR